MDWFSWLSKTNFNPSLVYQYALMFYHNELEQDDIPYFTHEFLQSMGVKVAKHRLEILKLAREENGGRNARLVLWLVLVIKAIKQTKKYLARHVRALVHRENSSLSMVPPRNHSLRWKVAMVQRNKRLRATPSAKGESPMSVPGHGLLMLTEGCQYNICDSRNSDSTQSLSWIEAEGNSRKDDALVNHPWNNSIFSSTAFHSLDSEYWPSSADEIRWDAMFHNLKPT